MWNSDGWEAGTRLGVLTAHGGVGAESELRAMAPPGVTIHASRVHFGAMAGGEMDPTIPLAAVRAFAEPPFVDEATELLAAAPLDAIGFAFTSSAYVIGADGEEAMIARLEARTRGTPLTTSSAAAVAALRALEIERLAIVSPPWFDQELNSLASTYFQALGFDVVFAKSADLPSNQRQIEPSHLFGWIRHHTPDPAEALLIPGNGFRAAGIIEALETDLARPVITANQALLWNLLDLADSDAPVTRYGRLFGCSPA